MHCSKRRALGFLLADHCESTSCRGYYGFAAGALLVSGSIASSHEHKSECSSHHIRLNEKNTPIRAAFIDDINSIYKIEEVIGEGGFGKVYRVRRIQDGKKMALKCISKVYSLRDDFQREIEALRKLNFDDGGHPHICKMYDIFEGENEYWLSMELVEGGEVFEHLIEKGAYSEAMAAIFLRQFAEALAFMHANGVVHADLKVKYSGLNIFQLIRLSDVLL